VCVYPTILPTSSIHQSNIPRPLLALRDPPIDHRAIPNLQSHLERLAIHRESVRHLVAAETVEDRLVAGFLRWEDFEGDDAAEEGGVEFAVGEVGADAPERWWLVGKAQRM
jgi:predicted transcriptional regulator